MKKQIKLTISAIFFTLLFIGDSFSQIITKDLTLSLATSSTKIDSSSVDKPKVSLNIKTAAKGTVKFSNLKLYLRPVAEADTNCHSTKCLSASVPLKANKIKNQEFITLDIALDSLHWHNVMASNFYDSGTKNLFDKVKSGEFQVSATVDIEAVNGKKKREITWSESNIIEIIFR